MGTSPTPAINLVFVSDSGTYPVQHPAPSGNHAGQDVGNRGSETFFPLFLMNIDPMME
jgi:hypothetical protein